jgi:hypothetical protein
MKQIVFSLSIVVLMFSRLDAVVVIPMTFEQLVDEATAVVYARVADVRGQWTADRRSIDSIVTLEALQYMKGDLGPAVAMRVPGGEVGGVVNLVPGAPSFRDGDLVVLFLKARGPAMLTPLGLTQGVFRVAFDAATRQMMVTPPPLKASAAGRLVRGAADRRTLNVTAFDATVRSMVAQ